MVVGRHGMGWQVFGRPYQRNPVVVDQMYGSWSDEPHRDDFCDAVRTRRLPNADIREGHLSTLLPQSRSVYRKLIKRWFKRKVKVGEASMNFYTGGMGQ